MSVLDQALARIGVQPRPYRGLIRALVLMDLRSQHFGRATGTKPGELIPPLYWVVGQYLFISAIVTGILFGRVSVEAFAWVNLSLAVVLAVSAVIVEFNEVVMDVGDLDLLGYRAISRRTYAAARLTNLMFYMGLIITALSVFPAIVGCGLRDSGPGFLPAYGLASVVGCAGGMFLVIVIFSLAPPRKDQQDFRDLLAWIQIAAAMAAFYGAQLMLRDSRHVIEMFLDDPPRWTAWLPSRWLAAWVAAIAQGPGLEHLPKAVALTGGLGLVGWFAWQRLMGHYSAALVTSQPAPLRPAHAPGTVPPVSPDRPLIGSVIRRLAGPGRPAGPLALCFLLLRRDQDLRIRTWPALASVLVFFLIGLCLGELANPFTAPAPTALGHSAPGMFSIVVLQLAVLAVPSLLHNMSYSRDHGATWLFHAAPHDARTTYSEASRKSVCYGILLPAMVLLWFAFACLWRSPLHATVHCTVGWWTILITSHLTAWGMDYPLPFARPAARGVVTGPVLPYVAGAGALATVVGTAEFLASRRWPAIVGLEATLILGWFVASRLHCRAARLGLRPAPRTQGVARA